MIEARPKTKTPQLFSGNRKELRTLMVLEAALFSRGF
jgi:hypothetical protein